MITSHARICSVLKLRLCVAIDNISSADTPMAQILSVERILENPYVRAGNIRTTREFTLSSVSCVHLLSMIRNPYGSVCVLNSHSNLSVCKFSRLSAMAWNRTVGMFLSLSSKYTIWVQRLTMSSNSSVPSAINKFAESRIWPDRDRCVNWVQCVASTANACVLTNSVKEACVSSGNLYSVSSG